MADESELCAFKKKAKLSQKTRKRKSSSDEGILFIQNVANTAAGKTRNRSFADVRCRWTHCGYRPIATIVFLRTDAEITGRFPKDVIFIFR